MARSARVEAMASTAQSFPTADPQDEQRIVLYGVPWEAYVSFRDALDRPGIRMTYLEGTLEIMSPSGTHEVSKSQIGRLLELFCLERGIPLYAYGSTTLRKKKKQRGLEADESYRRGEDGRVPHIALEVVVTRGAIDKLDVYRGLGVREVWVYEKGAFTVFVLHGDAYSPAERSEVLPEIDLLVLARHVAMPDQHAALLLYRDEIRKGS